MSTLSSMTGFARDSAQHGICAWVWEARSVNGRGLDLRIRVPKGFEAIEQAARKAFNSAFTRGNIQISLSVTQAAGQPAYEVDQVWLKTLTDLVEGGSGMSDPAHLPHLMKVDGVVRQINFADTLNDDLLHGITDSLNSLVSALRSARDAEGLALQGMLSAAVDSLDTYTQNAASSAASQPAALKAAFNASFAELIGEQIDPDKLAQEAALLAMKADVREELDRLAAHVISARTLMAQGSPIGRKLDFLSQEFNREINTLCSKSSSHELTQIGLDMKSVNEQFREQAANVE